MFCRETAVTPLRSKAGAIAAKYPHMSAQAFGDTTPRQWLSSHRFLWQMTAPGMKPPTRCNSTAGEGTHVRQAGAGLFECRLMGQPAQRRNMRPAQGPLEVCGAVSQIAVVAARYYSSGL